MLIYAYANRTNRTSGRPKLNEFDILSRAQRPLPNKPSQARFIERKDKPKRRITLESSVPREN